MVSNSAIFVLKFHIIAYLTQHRNVINFVAIGQRSHKAIAQARFPDSSLSFVFFNTA